MNKLRFLFILSVFASQVVWGQFDTTWTQTYGGNRDDNAEDVIYTADKGFLIIGSTSSFGFDNSQMYFLKVDSTGAIQWSKSHGGDGQEWGTSVIATSDGGYLGVGYTNSWGAGGFDIFMVKLSANGDLEYEAVKGGPDWDFAWDVMETSPGKYIIAGETQSFGNGDSDGWLLQFDNSTQTFDWETTVGESKTDNLKAVIQGYNNDLFGIGKLTPNNSTNSDIMLVRFNLSGDSLWSTFYGDTLTDFGNDLTLLGDSTIGITGGREINGIAPGVAVLKVDSLGTSVFDTLWSNSEYSQGNRIMAMDSFRFAIIGTSTIYDGNNDVFAAYTFPGNPFTQIATTLGSLQDDWGTGGVFLGGSGFLICGHSIGYDNAFRNILNFRTTKKFTVSQPNTFKFNEDTQNITSTQDLTTKNIPFEYHSYDNTIYWSAPHQANYVLYDLSGRRVYSGQFSGNLSISDLPISSGMYILHMINSLTNEFWPLKVLK